MFNEETQVADLDNTVEVVEETEEETESQETDEKDWKAEALKYKAILDRNKGKEVVKEVKPQSDGFGYDVKAYLKASGIQANEFDFVKAEMQASGKDVDSLLESKYFQEALENRRAINKTENATIKGKRSGGVSTDSVEYWASKDFADVPMNMRGKVLAHREAKEKNKGTFYNT